MEYFEQPFLTLPLLSFLGVMLSVGMVAGIEELMREEKSEGKVHFLATGRGFVILAAAIFIACAAVFFGAVAYWDDDLAQAAQAGDMFGGLTALFSGLAFAGLITTLFMQRQELKLQRQELELSRGEFKLQRFENTLFGLLELFNGHVQSLTIEMEFYRDSSVVPKSAGRAVLQEYSKFAKDEYSLGLYKGLLATLDYQREKYLADYEAHFEGNLGPYFRLLYNTMRHIEKAELTYDNHGNFDPVENENLQQKYSKIVRAYLSSAEIKLLMFNCATHLGEDFHPWVTKYQLLKHIRPDDAKCNPEMVRSFGPDAFGSRYKHLEQLMQEAEADRA